MFKQPGIIHQPIRRKFVHLTGIVFLMPVLVLNSWLALLVYAVTVVATWLLVRFVAYGLIAMCLILLLFNSEAAQAAWLAFIVGDGVAGIVGQRWGRKRLPWNPKKTVIGTATFLLGASATVALFYWWGGSVAMPNAIACAVVVAGVGSAVESLPLALNDNFTVVLACGAAAFAAMHLIT